MSKTILVTGATGKQGGAVIKALLEAPNAADFTILAVTRKPESASAKKLVEKGVKLVQGDLNDVPALFESAKEVTATPVWGVFSVQVPVMKVNITISKSKQAPLVKDGSTESEEAKDKKDGSIESEEAQGKKGGSDDGEEFQGKALVDGALAAGVEFFVYASVDRGGNDKSYETPTNIPHFISKHNIEHHLIEKAGHKMKWTILRPVCFADNLTPDFMGKGFATFCKVGLQGKKLQFVAVRDIGVFAAKAFLNPEEYSGKALSLAGDELNFDEINELFKRKTGADVPTTFEILARGMLWGIADLGIMFNWFHSDGYGADIEELKKIHPGLLDLDQWLEKESKFELKK